LSQLIKSSPWTFLPTDAKHKKRERAKARMDHCRKAANRAYESVF
jgi:hypothetical protein